MKKKYNDLLQYGTIIFTLLVFLFVMYSISTHKTISQITEDISGSITSAIELMNGGEVPVYNQTEADETILEEEYIPQLSWCYQESANQESIDTCNLNYNGIYTSNPICNDWHNDIWETGYEYCWMVTGNGYYYYVNYTKPNEVLKTANWQIEYGWWGAKVRINTTINNECLIQDNIQLKLQKEAGKSWAEIYCFDGMVWKNLQTPTFHSWYGVWYLSPFTYFSEEAIWWEIYK